MSTLLDDRVVGTEGAAGRERGAGTRRPHRTSGTASTGRANRSKAAQRALDRRERRGATRSAGATRVGEGAVATMTRKRVGGVPLVFPVLLMIVAALGLTLYLTTKSAQNSYALDSLRAQNQDLTDKRDELKRVVDQADSAPQLAHKARELGLVPSDGAMQITIDADGRRHRSGEAAPAQGKALPDLTPTEDPVDKIDASKVDDSKGLGDDAPSSAPTTSAPTTSAPSTSAPSSGAPDADAGDQSPAPAPNVMPSTAATPSAGPTRAR